MNIERNEVSEIAMEIEKKYKVKYLPKGYEAYPCKEIEQGYLCENPVVRIRRSNEDYILTYKSKFGIEDIKEIDARVNHEVEVFLNKEGYEHLKEKIDGNLITKKRYVIPLEEVSDTEATAGLKAELDIFESCLTGLIIVEVEFDSEKSASEFIPPEWFGEDVTFDKRYVNKNMIYINQLSEMNL